MKKIFVLLLLHASIIFGNPFLQTPKLVTAQELAHIAENDGDLDFTWSFSKQGITFNCLCYKAKPGFSLTSLTIPIDSDSAFKYTTHDGISLFAYTYGKVKKELRTPIPCSELSTDYYAATPLFYEKQSVPKYITLEQLAEFITQHTIVFYTGAGLSIASGLPSMEQLEKSLYLEIHDNELNIQKILSHSSEILESIKKFSAATIQTAPSAGHHAIAALAQKKQCAVFTENIDILHEKSGIEPLRVSVELQEDSKYFKDIDAIICIGLSQDDRGLLGLYKRQNPTGTIIAIDLKQPSYVSEDDYLIIGDAQEILPALTKMIVE